MSKGDVVFHNSRSGETLIHRNRSDGKTDLKIVRTGLPGDRGGHAVFDSSRNPVFIRDVDGRIIGNK